MTIGELLKQYRIKQNKRQKDFAAGIVSPSYYSKVEKNIHRITAEDLLAILAHNKISVSDFFARLATDPNQVQIQTMNKLFDKLDEAFYSENIEKNLTSFKKQVKQADLNDDRKEELILIADGLIETLKTELASFDNEVRLKIKEKLFSMPEFDIYKLTLYTNFMSFYDFDANQEIVRQIIKQFHLAQSREVQTVLLAIISNLLGEAVKEEKYSEATSFIDFAKTIPSSATGLWYKLPIEFYAQLIAYHQDKNKVHLNKCRVLIESMELGGVTNLSELMRRELDKVRTK